MKYIKSYENNIKTAFKKYLLTAFNATSGTYYYILETNQNNTDENLLQYVAYYEYSNEEKVLYKRVEVKNIKGYDEYNLIKAPKGFIDIIYQTNSLQDAKNALYTLFDLDKYNL